MNAIRRLALAGLTAPGGGHAGPALAADNAGVATTLQVVFSAAL